MSLLLERLEKAAKELDCKVVARSQRMNTYRTDVNYDHESNDLRILIEDAAKEIRAQKNG